MRKLLTLFAVAMLFSILAIAQTKTLSGKITDAKGQPVPFATIRVKGTKAGVSADADGNYTIKVSPSQTLIISGAGVTTTEVVASDASVQNITVTMKDASMTEVVVTALGIRRSKNELPYAVQQIGGDEVSKERSGNFITNMEGKVSGVTINQSNTLGGSTNVVLRGYKSILGDNQALFVIDGVPFDNANTNQSNNTPGNATRQTSGLGGYDYGNAAADINPDDIASISVLKGAAASALYGERGFNGVVLITTKKGRKGLGITLNGGVTTGAIDKSTFAKYQHSYGANYGSANEYGSPDGNFLYFDVNGDGTPDLVTPTTEDASWGAKFDPNLMVYQWEAFDRTSSTYHKATPWVAAAHDPTTFFVKPFSYNTSVLIDGGNDKATFKVGYTRNSDKGILPNSQILKDLVNSSATWNLTNKLTAGASINFSKISGLGRYGTGYDANNVATNFREWWETNVDINDLKNAYFRTKKNTTWNWADPSDEVNGLVPIYWNNPYYNRYESYETDSRYRYFGNVYLNYKPTDGLNFLARISLDSYDETQEERYAIGSIGVPYYSQYNHTFREYNYDFLANYNKDLTADLNFKALIGTNLRQDLNNSVFAQTNGGLFIPRLYTLANSINTPNPPTENNSNVEVGGVFAGATLTWRRMLTLDGTIRRDQSSTLPAGHNSYYYPSVSGGFIFSELMKDVSWLSYGKLRGNYAEVGHSAPSYSIYDTYTIGTSFGSQPVTSANGTKNNPNLVPERNKSYEFGVESRFLHDRVGFDVTYYNARTQHQILPTQISDATGYDARFLNAGEVENKGFEVSVTGTPIKTRDFSWDITVNWTRNRNKVIALYDTASNIQIAAFQGNVTLNATKGQPYGTIRGNDFIYTNGQRTVKSNGYYAMTSTSNSIIGNPNPDWIGSISNTFRYKGFSLTALIDARKGGDIFSLDMYYGLATGLYPETAGKNDLGNPVRNSIADGGGIIYKGVTSDGKINTKRVDISTLFGAYGYYRNPAKAFVYDAGFVKLREVALNYTLPEKVVSKLGNNVFKGIDVSVVGRNLWIIHKNLPYADPEDIISSGNAALGYQVGSYPTARTFAFNLKLRF